MSHKTTGVHAAGFLGAVLFGAGAALVAAAGATAEGDDADFALVAEMEPLAGITAQPPRSRAGLTDRAAARRGLERLELWVRAHWPRLRQIDLLALSRFHVEQTRGFELPAEPGELTGRAIGYDQASGLWSLELRGPRLPARYDIVHRYLHVYARFDEASGELDRLTVTIRGWVLE